MAAKIVVIVKDQDLRGFAHFLPKEIGSGESTDATSDDNEVQGFAGIDIGAEGVWEDRHHHLWAKVKEPSRFPRIPVLAGGIVVRDFSGEKMSRDGCSEQFFRGERTPNRPAPVPKATPFRKSRREISRFMPSSLSLFGSLPRPVTQCVPGSISRLGYPYIFSADFRWLRFSLNH